MSSCREFILFGWQILGAQAPSCNGLHGGAFKKHGGAKESQPARPNFSRKRAHSRARGYIREYEKLRLIRIQRNPLCQHEGCDRPTETIDHIVPLAMGGANKLANRQSLCWPHHDAKTALDRIEIASFKAQTRTDAPT